MHRHSVENPSAPWATQQEDLLQHASGEGNRTKARISTGSEAIGNDNNKKGDHHTADHEHRRKVEAPGKQRRHARGALVPPNSHRGVIVDEDGRIRLTTLPSSPTVRVRRDPTEQGHGSAHCRTPYGSGGLAVIGVAVSFLVVMGIIFGVVKAVSG